MAIIKIDIKDNIATNLTPEIEIVSANEEYKVEFSFDSTWESANLKTARFWYNFKHVDVVFEGNVCDIPPLQETELVKVGVFTDTQKTTTDAEIKCKYSIKKYGGNVHEPTKDVYGQIIDLLNKYIEQGGSGGVNREEVEQIIRDYLVKNPVQDGFSPTVKIEDIENGTRVTITDINGAKSFDVLNGTGGTGSSVELDTTLTEEGKAADAKAVGDALADKVGFTDYANGSKAGIITTKGTYGARNFDTEIAGIGRTVSQYNTVQDYYLICKKTLENIKYDYVKRAITTNNITLTEEEQEKAQDWLGISGNSGGGATDEWISLGVYTEQNEMGQEENTGIDYSVAVPKFINIYGSLNLDREWGGEQGAGYDNVGFNVSIPYNASNFGSNIPFAVIGYSSYSGAIYRVSGNARIVKTTNDDGSIKITAEHSGSYFTITDITDKTDYSIDYTNGYSYETKILTHKD